MRKNKQRGMAVIELAILLLPMLILCFGITELGRSLYYYNGLVKATRGATRYLTTQNPSSPPSGETVNTIRDRARALAVCGQLACATNAEPLVPGLTLAQVSVCDKLMPAPCNHSSIETGQGSVDLVSVTIGGTGSAAFNFTSLASWVIPDFTFAPVTTTMASQFF